MAHQKYIYNKKTLRYEKYQKPLSSRIGMGLLAILVVLASGYGIQLLMGEHFPTAKEKSLGLEMQQMGYKYTLLNDKLDVMSSILSKVKTRDAEVHRVMFGMDPIDDGLWEGGIGGHDGMQDITDYGESTNLLKSTQQKIENLQHQLAVQSRSLDTLFNLASDKEKMLASMPSIKPVQEDKLKQKMRFMSGYGWRIHPIHKVKRMHNGLDFSAPEGTPVQAPGDGRVKMVKNKRTGYGKHIVIDHGYGYTTLYAHLNEIKVRQGQQVKRGQIIATIGNTGTSTASHLHYEVRYKGRATNPIHYCMDGLTPEEYAQLVEKASTENQSFD